jgi:hypothetical protein
MFDLFDGFAGCLHLVVFVLAVDCALGTDGFVAGKTKIC